MRQFLPHRRGIIHTHDLQYRFGYKAYSGPSIERFLKGRIPRRTMDLWAFLTLCPQLDVVATREYTPANKASDNDRWG